MNPVKIILSRTSNPDNIGAAARAMANFGFDELALAAPYMPSWAETLATADTAGSGLLPGAGGPAAWLAGRGRAAVGAAGILRSARVYPAAAEAAADCALLLGASALSGRSPDRDVVPLPELPAWLAERGRGKAGMLFGSEKTGLSNEELGLCHAIVRIPAGPRQPSVNLGQAVALVCYELAGRGPGAAPCPARRAAPLPPLGEVERLAGEACALLEAWGQPAGARLRGEIRRGLLDARLTKGAAAALKALLKRARGGGGKEA